MTPSFPHSRIAPSVRSGLPLRRGWARAGWAGVLLAALIGPVGCKSKSVSGPITKNDPLMSDQRIPPTIVPLPEPNGGLGNRAPKNDPLLGSPTGRDKTGASRKDDVDRWKGPFIPSQEHTPAALAAKLRSDHSDLALEEKPTLADRTDRGVKLQPVGGAFPTPVVPSGTPETPVNLGLIPQVLQDDLAALGINRGDYEMVKMTGGEYAVRARVRNASGTTTSYEETGASAAAAVHRLIDQLKSDRPK